MVSYQSPERSERSFPKKAWLGFSQSLRLFCTLVIALNMVGSSLPQGSPASEAVPLFRDVTADAGIVFQHVNGRADRKDYIFEAKGGGAGFFDYDNDGWLDVLIVQGSTLERIGDPELHSVLYRNQRNGTFVDVSAQAGLDYSHWGMGVTSGDYDNDGDVDLYITHLGPNVLYRNNGDGTFTDVTKAAGVAVPQWSTSAAFGDYDSDGDLDLYVAGYLDYGVDNLPPKTSDCTYLGQPVLCGPRGLRGAPDVLFRNEGNGTFTDVSQQSGAVDSRRSFGLGVIWADLDNDQDLDILVSNDATPNLLFLNQGDGTFVEMGFLSGLAVNADGMEQASMGVDAADYDNDGLLDVFMAHFASDYSTLYHNDGNLLFRDVSHLAGIKDTEWLLVSWGTRFIYVNLDGWKDLIHSNGHVYPYLIRTDGKERYPLPGTLYLNRKNGTFTDVSNLAGGDFMKPTVSRGVAFGDYDNDGDIDFLVANMNGTPQLFRCDRNDSNHWVMFKLVGSDSNRDAIGARVTITTGDLKQVWEIKRTVGIYSVSDPRAHFGIGSSDTVDVVEIWWPSGATQRFIAVAADTHYLLREGDKIEKEEY